MTRGDEGTLPRGTARERAADAAAAGSRADGGHTAHAERGEVPGAAG